MKKDNNGDKRVRLFHRGNGVGRLLKILEEMGFDLWPEIQTLGIRPQRLFEPDYFLSMEQEFEIFKLAKAVSGCPHLGLVCGMSYNFASFGALGLALMTAPTLQAALDFGFKNLDLTFAYLHFDYHIDSDRLIIDTQKPLDLRPHDIFIVERDLTACKPLFSDILGEPLHLDKACFSHPAPDYAERYQEILNCAVEFNAASNRLELPVELLDRKLPKRDQYAHNTAREQAAYLQRHIRPQPNTVQRVIKLFLGDPPRFSRLESAAGALHMSSRTLRRKLDQEGTTFSDLTHNLRHRLATDYLASDLGLDEVAARLGYSDAVNFSHAFKRWTGLTPGQYRKSLQR